MTRPEPSPEMQKLSAQRTELDQLTKELDQLRAALARREGDLTYRMNPDEELAFAEIALVEFNEETKEIQ